MKREFSYYEEASNEVKNVVYENWGKWFVFRAKNDDIRLNKELCDIIDDITIADYGMCQRYMYYAEELDKATKLINKLKRIPGLKTLIKHLES